jgi:pantothenate kinase
MDYTYGLMATRARYIHALERQISPAKRVVIALAGPPGSGKSTAAQKVIDLLNQGRQEPWAQLVPMDGFHYPQQALDEFPNRTEAYARRGADWTFDAAKLLDFVRVLRQFDTDSQLRSCNERPHPRRNRDRSVNLTRDLGRQLALTGPAPLEGSLVFSG